MQKNTGRTHFKLGNPGNPKGRPKLDPELKALRTRTREDVEKIILTLYDKNESALNKILANADTSFWEKHVARIILRGVAKGELAPFLALSDYIFGKQIEKVQVTSINQNIQTNVTISEMIKNPALVEDLIQLEAKFRTLSKPSA